MARAGKGGVAKVAILAAVVVAGAVGGGLWLKGAKEPDSSGGPLAARRLTQDQYKTIIADVFGADVKIGGRFEPDIRKSGLLAVGTSEVAVTPAGFEQYDSMARTIADQVVDEQHRGMLIGCTPKAPTGRDDACAGQFLGEAGRLLYRRPLTDAELSLRVKVAGAAADKLGDFYKGLSMGLAQMLESPQFLFRQETGKADPAHAGALVLDDYSKAARLSFFLWNTTPDDALLTAAAKGELDTADGLAKQVDRLMASPRVEAGVRAFFTDMLKFDSFALLTKDAQLYPKFTPAVSVQAQEQTLRTITDHLLVGHGDYRDLFTTRKTQLTPLLGTIYKVPVEVRDGWVAHEWPKGDPRAGLLTQISFLTQNSHPGRSSPTLRGKALREVLLCQHVPDPPGNVSFKVVQETDNPVYRTARARLDAHNTDATCAGCHKLIDPMGLALENFDTIGGYRAAENGAAIDPTGEIDGHKFANAVELGQAIHDHPEAPSCLVTRLYSYGVGRAPSTGETEWMGYLNARFAAEGYKLPELMRRIATSEAFYRATQPAPSVQPTAAAESPIKTASAAPSANDNSAKGE